MLIDRNHNRWFQVSALIVAIGAVVYSVESLSPHGATGGSVLGLIFGIVGSVFMVIAALLAVRKRLPTWRVGSAQAWLRAHLWLGTVGFVLILFHSGFGWGGLLENLLWISFGLVVVTGFAGLALQQVIPKLLTSEVPLETFVAQISFLAKTMLFRADQLVATQTGPLEVPFESLTPFAAAVLKQQGVLKRESDLPKELAKVYANVPQPEVEKKGHAAEKPALVPKPPVTVTPVIAEAPAEPTTDQAAPAVKPKSPLELMQEKKAAAAKKADSKEAESKEAASVPETAVAEPTATKPKSPLELMREKKAAAQSSATTSTSAAASKDSSSSLVAEPAAPPTDSPSEKKLSPLEQMRAKKAALQSSVTTASEKRSEKGEGEAPVEPRTEEKDDSAGASPSQSPAVSEKKLSPMEIMRAKMAAEKGSPADKAADAPKPLTVVKEAAEQQSVTAQEILQASGAASPPVAKKPLPISKSVANADASVASTATKPKAVVISPIQTAELRDFHLKIVRPYLDKGISPQHGLNELITARRLFGQLKSDLPTELHEVLEQLASFCEERRQFAVQKRLHRWMHWWLILHIPPSIALIVLFVAHVVMSLRVVPFGR